MTSMQVESQPQVTMQCQDDPKLQIFETLLPLLRQKSPFVEQSPIDEDFPSSYLSTDFPVLVIGAGGLGCEILKNLALTGFQTIHVIDLDIIDLSNLNRQFLFRIDDVGKPKAKVAADFIMKRIPTVTIIPHYSKIQELDDNFYRQFVIIIAGLDNVEARRWINAKVHSLTQFDKGEIVQESKKVFIDGGTEKFNGQVLVVRPFETSCYECILSTLPKTKVFNSCTIANIPRIPEHCIQYAKQILWNKEFGENTKIDSDSKQHILWLYQKALERAQNFGIKGVTEQLTLGVIKNIIPAIASTNCLIAAACTNQAFKITTGTNPTLNNLFYYKGMSFIGSDTYEFSPSTEIRCVICSRLRLSLTFNQEETLGTLEKQLIELTGAKKYITVVSNKGFLINSAISQFDGYKMKKINELIVQGIYGRGDNLHVTFKEGDNNIFWDVSLQLTE